MSQSSTSGSGRPTSASRIVPDHAAFGNVKYHGREQSSPLDGSSQAIFGGLGERDARRPAFDTRRHMSPDDSALMMGRNMRMKNREDWN